MSGSKTKRVWLGNDYARDGHALLHMVWHRDSPGWLREVPAVDVLRRVLVQNKKVSTDRAGREVVTLRDAGTDGLPPGRSGIVSPYDLDARWGGKRDLAWCGFKLHISESCDAEASAASVDAGDWVPDEPPNLVTNVTTTDASVPDTVMTGPIHQALAAREVLPGEHYLDSGYPSADLPISSLSDYGVRLVTPMLADTSPQARAGVGLDRNGFTIDWDVQTVACPQGKTGGRRPPPGAGGRRGAAVTRGRAAGAATTGGVLERLMAAVRPEF